MTIGALSDASDIVKSCANTIATPSKFVRLIPDLNYPEGSVYFGGNDTERSDHADTMYDAGRKNAELLLNFYGPSIDPKLPILEIGPFLRPLGRLFAKDHPWLVWEYDQQAGQKIADSREGEVFSVDLNNLSQEDWKSFIAENKIAVGKKKTQRLNLGLAIMSSVLNYIDYQIVLPQVISNMADGGLLIIANSNAGDHAMMRGKAPPNGSRILEFLLSSFPNQIELLPKTEIIEQSFDGTRTKVVIAARINKKLRDRNSPLDLYAQGIGIFVDYKAKPPGIDQPARGDWTYILRQSRLKEIWYSADPNVVAQAIEDIKTKKYAYHLGPAPLNRLAEISHALEENKQLRTQVLQIDVHSAEGNELRKQLEKPLYERFLPEREILLQALEMAPSKRPAFVEKQLKQLFKRLRHSE